MAHEVVRVPPGRVVEPTRVWTVLVKGGHSFTLTLTAANAPPLDHDGGSTLWKLPASEDQIQTLLATIREHGATVEVFTEVQTPDQTVERILTTGQSGLRQDP